jgi:hypothetical protein
VVALVEWTNASSVSRQKAGWLTQEKKISALTTRVQEFKK